MAMPCACCHQDAVNQRVGNGERLPEDHGPPLPQSAGYQSQGHDLLGEGHGPIIMYTLFRAGLLEYKERSMEVEYSPCHRQAIEIAVKR